MLLKKGDKNEQVRQLQVKLGVDPVSTFGPKTEDAVLPCPPLFELRA